jgi:hypothetical protein
VSHIGNPKSVHYKEIREELIGLGKEEFTTRYITEDIQDRIAKAEVEAVVQMGNDAAAREDANIRTPTKMRSKDRGTHVRIPEGGSYSHRIQIEWVVGFYGEGWYYRDLDGPFPEKWLHTGPESTLSSTAALRGIEAELTD